MRVSSPDRVVYEATDRTPEVTKLMVAEYFASVGEGLMRARWDQGNLGRSILAVLAFAALVAAALLPR